MNEMAMLRHRQKLPNRAQKLTTASIGTNVVGEIRWVAIWIATTFHIPSRGTTITRRAQQETGSAVTGCKGSVPKRLVPGVKEDDLLRAFLEHIPDGVYFKDRESRFVRISRSLAIRFGLSDPAEAINKTDFDMFSEEHAQQAFADEQDIIRTGCPIIEAEERETWPDGRESWVLTTKLPLMDHKENIIGTMGISRDVTERKLVAQELQKHRVRLEELVEERTAELRRTNQELERDIAVRKAVEKELAQKAEELARSYAVLENLSLIDELTGLYNRKGFLALAEHRVRLANRTGETFSIAFADLDGLKRINDEFGHHEGDRALVDAANVLRECFRESDIVARLGGDEFAMFIAEADDSKIATIRSRIQQNLDICNSREGRHYCLSFSTGIVSVLGPKTSDLETLLAQADALMYQQKSNRQFPRDEGTVSEPDLS
jgi:diguanylate cyclase (GGDEF)-like protein/PAS domain S-box-containing protein